MFDPADEDVTSVVRGLKAALHWIDSDPECDEMIDEIRQDLATGLDRQKGDYSRKEEKLKVIPDEPDLLEPNYTWDSATDVMRDSVLNARAYEDANGRGSFYKTLLNSYLVKGGETDPLFFQKIDKHDYNIRPSDIHGDDNFIVDIRREDCREAALNYLKGPINVLCCSMQNVFHMIGYGRKRALKEKEFFSNCWVSEKVYERLKQSYDPVRGGSKITNLGSYLWFPDGHTSVYEFKKNLPVAWFEKHDLFIGDDIESDESWYKEIDLLPYIQKSGKAAVIVTCCDADLPISVTTLLERTISAGRVTECVEDKKGRIYKRTIPDYEFLFQDREMHYLDAAELCVGSNQVLARQTYNILIGETRTVDISPIRPWRVYTEEGKIEKDHGQLEPDLSKNKFSMHDPINMKLKVGEEVDYCSYTSHCVLFRSPGSFYLAHYHNAKTPVVYIPFNNTEKRYIEDPRPDPKPRPGYYLVFVPLGKGESKVLWRVPDEDERPTSFEALRDDAYVFSQCMILPLANVLPIMGTPSLRIGVYESAIFLKIWSNYYQGITEISIPGLSLPVPAFRYVTKNKSENFYCPLPYYLRRMGLTSRHQQLDYEVKFPSGWLLVNCFDRSVVFDSEGKYVDPGPFLDFIWPTCHSVVSLRDNLLMSYQPMKLIVYVNEQGVNPEPASEKVMQSYPSPIQFVYSRDLDETYKLTAVHDVLKTRARLVKLGRLVPRSSPQRPDTLDNINNVLSSSSIPWSIAGCYTTISRVKLQETVAHNYDPLGIKGLIKRKKKNPESPNH